MDLQFTQLMEKKIKEIKGNNQEINISDLANGLYLIELTFNEKSLGIQKFIKIE